MQSHQSVCDGGTILPFTMLRVPVLQCQPGGAGMEQLRDMGFLKGNALNIRDAGTFLKTVINWQRRNCRFDGVSDRYCIGGEALLTRIDASGVTQTVAERWND